jgi:hypothetical protein
MNISRLIFIILLLYFVPVNSVFAENDRVLLTQKGYVGGFTKSNCKKVSGKITLVIYQPSIDYKTSHGLPNINKTPKLTIEYDEIWERKEYADKITVYMKNNQIQACVVRNKLVANPLTGQKFSKPEYIINSLETRAEVMKNY